MPKPKIIDTADTMTSSKLSALKKAGVETIIRYDDRRPRGGWKQIHPAEAKLIRDAGSAQAASACAGSGVLQSTAALSGWAGGVRDGALLGAGVERAWPRGATDAGAIREGVHQAQQTRCRRCGSDLRADDALCAGQDG